MLSLGQRKWVEPSVGILWAIQVPFVPLPPERVTCVSLRMDLSKRPLAEAKGKAGVDIHDRPLRIRINSTPTRLALKGPPPRLLEITVTCLMGSRKKEACVHIALGKPEFLVRTFHGTVTL